MLPADLTLVTKHPRVTRENSVELRYGILGECPDGGDQTWLLFHQEASVGRDADASLVVNDSGVDFAADISFREQGLWITPRAGNSVHLGRYEFFQAVPLPVGCDIGFGASAWRIEKPGTMDPRPQVPSLVAATA